MEVVRPRTGCEVLVTIHGTASLEPRMDIHDNARTAYSDEAGRYSDLKPATSAITWVVDEFPA